MSEPTKNDRSKATQSATPSSRSQEVGNEAELTAQSSLSLSEPGSSSDPSLQRSSAADVKERREQNRSDESKSSDEAKKSDDNAHGEREPTLSPISEPEPDSPRSKAKQSSLSPVLEAESELATIFRLKQSPSDIFDSEHVTTRPVPADHPIQALWPTLCGEIGEFLDQQSIPWTLITCLRRFLTSGDPREHHETVVVASLRDKTPEWAHLGRRLHQFLEQRALGYLDVEILDDEVTFCDDRVPGTSVSVHGSGTVGGFLRIRSPDGTNIVVAATCHHVVKRGHNEDACKPLPFKLDGYPDLPARWPSDAVQENDNRELMHAMRDYRTDCTELEKGLASGYDPQKQEELQTLQGDILRLQQQLKRNQIKDRTIGQVVCTSGLTCYQEQLLDWALIGVASPAACHNMYDQSREPMKPRFARIEKITGFASPQVDLPVFKRGFATGLTYGTCNGIRPLTRVKLLGVAYAWQVTSDVEESFAAGGDSGSLVIDRHGNAVGLIHTRVVSIKDLAMMTDMTLVVQSILDHIRPALGPDVQVSLDV